MKAIINNLKEITILGTGHTEELARHNAAAIIAHRSNTIDEWYYSEEPGYSGGILVDVDSVLADRLENGPDYGFKLKAIETTSGITLMIDESVSYCDVAPSDVGTIAIFGRKYSYAAREAGFAGKPDSLCIEIKAGGSILSHCFIDENIDQASIVYAAKNLVAEYEGVLARRAAEAELGLIEEIDFS